MKQIIVDIIMVLGYALVASIVVDFLLGRRDKEVEEDAQLLRVQRRRGFFDDNNRDNK